MRAFPSFIQPSRRGHRAAATAVVVALVAGLAAGFSLFGATAPAAAATGPVSAGLTSVGPFTKTTAASMAAASGPIAIMAATPDPVNPVWSEDFGTGNANAQQISTYKPGSYTADAYWNNGQYCNGVILAYNTTIAQNTAACNTWAVNNVRSLAEILGRLAAGTTTASDATRNNRAVVEWTEGGPAVAQRGTRMLITSSDLGLPGDRYYLPQIDIAETSCSSSPSNITVGLQFGTYTAAQTATSNAVVTCSAGTQFTGTSPTNGNTFAIRANTLRSTNAIMLPAANASSLRLVVTNSNVNDGGNDVAIDSPRIMDVTPRLTQSFDATTIPLAGVSTLTFTITNTAEAGAKQDMRFTNTLPAGLVVADPSAVGGTCNAVNGMGDGVTYTGATAGSTSLSVSGLDFAAGATSCTMTVDVRATAVGTYTNATSNFSNANLLLPDDATLVVQPNTTLSVSKVLSGNRLAAADQFELGIYQGSTAVGATVTTTGTGSTVNGSIQNRNVTPGETYVISERVTNDTNSLNYSSSYTCTRASDGTTIASGASANGTLTMPDEVGTAVNCVFTNAPQPNAALACSPYTYYSLAQTGQIVEINSASGVTRNVAAWPSAGGNVNAFAIAKDGTAAYAVRRTSNVGVTTILRYTPGSTPTTTAASIPTAGNLAGTAIVAGALDPSTGNYYFGGFRDNDTDSSNGSRFWLWSYNPGTGATAFTGYISTPSTAVVGNGDMAFDKDGNLYVIGAESEGSGSTTINVFVVRAAVVAAATGSTTAALASAVTTPDTVSGVSNVNGVAFSSRGTVYLSGNNAAREFDPMTWNATGTSTVSLSGVGDLASCASPTTLTVQKNIVARATTNNPQITLSVRNSDGDTVASATTTGTGTGIQSAAQIGPLPARIGSTVSIGEAAATGNLAGYRPSVYECWADGRRISNGVLVDETANGRRSTDVTIPNQLSVATTCTIFNSPQDYATVTLRKAVSNGVGASPTAASGWVLRADAATAGFPTSAGTLTATAQDTTGTSGAITSYYIFGAQASTSIVVSEVQQAGYQLQSLVCQVGSSTLTPTTSTQTIDGQARIAATLTNVAPGSVVDCTFTNRPVATLTLVKNVAYGSASTNVWNLVATKADTGALNGPSGVSGSAGASATVSSGAVYRLSETVTTGNAATAAPYNNAASGTWSCVAGSTTVPVSAAGDITLTRGTNVTCTVTNTTATITLLKDMQSGFPSGTTPAAWNLTATPATGSGLSTFTVAGAASQSASNTFNARPGVAYTLSEALASTTSTMPWRQLRLERLSGSTWVTVTSNTITAPDAGTNAVYRYVNAPIVQPTLPLTGGLGSDAFLYAGAGIVALALALALWHQRRRFRNTAI